MLIQMRAVMRASKTNQVQPHSFFQQHQSCIASFSPPSSVLYYSISVTCSGVFHSISVETSVFHLDTILGDGTLGNVEIQLSNTNIQSKKPTSFWSKAAEHQSALKLLKNPSPSSVQAECTMQLAPLPSLLKST